MYCKEFAIVDDGIVVEYPVDPRVRENITLPDAWFGGEINGKTYVFCHDRKSPSAWDEEHIEQSPVYDQDRGLWYRQYVVQKISEAEKNEIVMAATDAAENAISALLEEFSEANALSLQLSPDQRNKWALYREELAAIVHQPGFPMEAVWPERPTSGPAKLEVVRV